MFLSPLKLVDYRRVVKTALKDTEAAKWRYIYVENVISGAHEQLLSGMINCENS